MQESGETYLETILILKQRNGKVRSIDIAHELDFSKPSVSRAVGILKEEGFIAVDQNGYIELTEKGSTRAGGIYERHKCITQFLMNTLGVDYDTAEDDACRIEHIISEASFEEIKKYVQKNCGSCELDSKKIKLGVDN